MKVQCSKCGGDTDTGFTCVKCGHSMQPHTGGIQATDTQQLKAEIAQVLSRFEHSKVQGCYGCSEEDFAILVQLSTV